MIHLLLAHLERLSEESWHSYILQVPERTRLTINRFRRREDRQARLLGKLLLLKGLRHFLHLNTHIDFDSLDAFGRPFIKGPIDYPVDFNISHSDEYVVCAITDDGRVGVDIERVKPIILSEIEPLLTFEEFEKIKRARSPYKEFYDLWTIKESVLKADGRGHTISLHEVTFNKEKAKLNGQIWSLSRLNIDPNYSCHLATNLVNPKIQVKKIKF